MSAKLIRYFVDEHRLAFERKLAWAQRIVWISLAAAVFVFFATVVHAGGIVDPGIWRGRDIKNGKRDWQVGAPAETLPPAHFHRNPPGRGQLAVFSALLAPYVSIQIGSSLLPVRLGTP